MEQRIHVLLIEDDLDAALLLSMQLNAACGADLRFTMESTERLETGLAKLKADDFSLILLDLMLPDSQGIETVSRAKAACGEIPIVVMTGMADETLGLEAVAAGAQDYLLKEKLDHRGLRRALSYAVQRSMARRLEQIEAEITERRRIETFKDQVIGTVAHELRSPLTVTKAAIANLADGLAGAVNEEQRQLVEVAGRNLERLSRIISNFLELSRLESGQAKISALRVDARMLLAELLDGMRIADRETKLVWENGLPAGLPPVRVDPDLFCQMFQNLLDNASRFAKKVVRVEAAVEGATLILRVRDDGPGVPADKASRLFERFSQIERKPVGGYKGTGLGLSICREIARATGGRIWLETEGEGGVFCVALPLWTQEARPAKPGDRRARAPSAGRR
jgi:signal transduction histidine kinase